MIFEKKSLIDLNFRSDDVITFKLHSCVPKTLVIKHANFGAIRTNFATDIVIYAFFNLPLEGARTCDDVIIYIFEKPINAGH